MKLRERFALTMVGITLILIGPALYGLTALQDLREIAAELRSRDAVGALALGRLQTAFSDVEANERIYLALVSGSEGSAVRARVVAGMDTVEAELGRLSQGEYEETVQPAVAAWRTLRSAVEQEHRLLQSGQAAAADAYRVQTVDPAFRLMDRSLDPIGRAINERGADAVRQAQTVATRASTTTLVALAIALAVAILIASWLARSVLLPIQTLRRAMGVVAGGDFSPELSISPERKDEIGDLARSFRWMTKQLTELERLRAQFVAVASHELKTPLSVIKGYVSLVREQIYGPVTPEQEKVLTSVSDQTDRLGRLIQQLLDVSRFEAGGGRLEIQTISVSAFLNDLSMSFEALALQNDIDFQVEIDPSLPPNIEGDPDRLNEVVGNLLSNAFKFTPRKGKIVLAAKPGERAEDSGILIEVRDTGVGIPEDQLQRVFEKFYQLENEAQPLSVGSGLGLAISKEIVEGHGGTITADSREGSGTVFRVFLPMAPPTSERAPTTRSR